MSAPKESGHAGRKRRRGEGEQRRRDESKRRKQAGAELPPHLVQYAALGPPPADPLARVEWANHAGAILLWEVLQDPVIDAPTRWRVAGELVGKIGLTHSKASTAQRVRTVLDAARPPKKPKDVVLVGPGPSLRAKPGTVGGGAE